MKLRRALIGLIAAFGILYLGGASLTSDLIAGLGLLLVTGICLWLLMPEARA
jgi:hypothetical protein